MRELDARYLLYRSQNLQENMRWKALAEIYTMYSFAPLSNLKIFANFGRARSRLYRSRILQVNTYAFESSRRDLHNVLLCTALQSQFFVKNCQHFR